MSYTEAIFANMINMVLNTAMFGWVAVILLGTAPSKSFGVKAKIFFEILAAIIVTAVVATLVWKKGLFDLPLGAGKFLLDYFMLLIIAAIVEIIYRETRMVCWVTALFIDILTAFGVQLSDWLVPTEYYELSIMSERTAYLIYMWVIGPVCVMLVTLIFHKAGVGKLYRQLIQYNKIRPGFVVFISLYPVLSQVLVELANQGRRGDINPAVMMMFLVFIYLIFVYASREEGQRQQIEAQSISLQQQNVYIENLEDLQREVRRFRHDFQNMMSGMYLHAEEGNLEELQIYIQQITADFDCQVGAQIRMMNQLANIHMLEVRGLLLGKLSQMQKEDISCQLEVLCPVWETGIRTTDLCRCMGILIDNAMEEVHGKKEGKIHIMISNQKGCTTFRVQNTLFSPVDFSHLGKQGYSTKGTGRGIGLASYRSILSQYDSALSSTTVQNGYFIQELKIMNT